MGLGALRIYIIISQDSNRLGILFTDLQANINCMIGAWWGWYAQTIKNGLCWLVVSGNADVDGSSSKAKLWFADINI